MRRPRSNATGRPAALLAALLAAAAFAEEPPRALADSLVRIVNHSERGDWYTPWDTSGVSESTASGFVIDGGLVMTNAHAVSDSRLLTLYLHGDPEPHLAHVLQVAHDCDLALLRPVEEDLLDRVPALAVGEGLPDVGSVVETLGYPAGGTQLSSTRGIVSRIEVHGYVHSSADAHLTVQTDAAINPGNSGGPVVQDRKVVGVAFQAVEDLQGVGFFIPTEVIERFLADALDGHYDGYPDLGAEWVTLQNPAARAKARMRERETGVRVDLVWPGGSLQGKAEEGDVVLEIEGRPIANDGSVAEGTLRFPFDVLVDRRQIGGTVKLGLLRQGERLAVDVPLKGAPGARIRSNAYDRLPRYYVYGGLVFVPLERETMETFGPEWPSRADETLLHEFLVRPYEEPERVAQERVVLLRKLDHPVNANMAYVRNMPVERVNGRPVTRLEDLIEAIEGHDGRFHVIELSNHGALVVLDRRAADAANATILEGYGVPKDRRF